jgi:hypothetical protein
VDAADLDVATAGPDISRGIYPQVKIVTKDGIIDLQADALRQASEALLATLKG